MTTNEVRQKYLEFFRKKGHKIIPSARLVPDNDPTTLFTGSGMQPLVPFLLGEKHPEGNRIANSQKCFRSQDIDDVGDNRHTTFFEMLGNWSFGDYFKKEQISWVFEFLIDEIKLDPKKIYITVFRGDEKNNIPKDLEVIELWKKLFEKKNIEALDVDLINEENASKRGIKGNERIFAYDSKKNWWSRSGVPESMPVGEPGGPDSEIFYEFTDIKHDLKFGEHCHPNCDCGKFLEIGNSVFMEHKKTERGFEHLPQKNVDFGGGLERLVAVTENKSDIFEIDTLRKIIEKLEEISEHNYKGDRSVSAFRVIADHIRSSVFLIGDEVVPSNTGQGYVLRRLLRRVIRKAKIIDMDYLRLVELIPEISKSYSNQYPYLLEKKDYIKDIIMVEINKFQKPLDFVEQYRIDLINAKDSNIIKKIKDIPILSSPTIASGNYVYQNYQTYGVPIDLSKEIIKELGLSFDSEEFNKKFEEHKDLSRSGSEQKFKGGLGDTSDKSLQYHTATHLLHQALREVLGETVGQKGSNITPERLRFDFSFGEKMTEEQKKKVEEIVNQKINEALPVQVVSLPKEEAEKTGAIHFFGEKYPDTVTVYFIGKDIDSAFSKEFCGGPHVKNTSELKGKFKIQKEEAVSAGVRRIKALLE